MTATALIIIAAAGTANTAQGVLLDFTATWCGPCRQMTPIVSRLARQGHPIRKVDVDQHPDLVRKYGIRSIPAFVLVVKGKEVTRVVGYASERRLLQMMARIPKAPAASSRPRAKALPITKPSADSAPVRLVKDVGSRFRLPFLSKQRQRERAIDQPPAELKNAIVRAKLDQNDRRPARVVRDVPMATSVRIRVKNAGGVSYGSGTIIASREGRTIVLTCGHVFRGLTEDSTIEIDVFEAGEPTTFIGTALRYNLQADVGLMAIPTRSRVTVAPLATLEDQAARGDHVFSIGCGSGKKPSKLQMRVTNLNRYRGPDNIECSGVPEQGRSGGGLFNAKGEIIGVCFAADPRDRRGLYAGLRPIYKLISDSKLDQLVATSRGRADVAAHVSTADSRRASARGNADVVIDQERLRAMQASAGIKSAAVGNVTTELDDPRGRLKTVADVFGKSPDAEVICVIRSLSDPQAASRVVIINRASKKFVEYLNNELRDQPVATTKSVRYSRTAARSFRRPSPSPTQTSARRFPTKAVQTANRGDESERYRRSPESR